MKVLLYILLPTIILGLPTYFEDDLEYDFDRLLGEYYESKDDIVSTSTAETDYQNMSHVHPSTKSLSPSSIQNGYAFHAILFMGTTVILAFLLLCSSLQLLYVKVKIYGL